MADSSSTTKQKVADDVVDEVDIETDLSYVATMFDNVNDAKEAYKELMALQREGIVSVVDAAYVEKIKNSKIKIYDHNRNDWDFNDNYYTDFALTDFIAGVILMPAAIGSLLDGIWTNVYDTTFAKKDLKELADSLPIGTSAFVAIVEDDYVDVVEYELSNEGGKKVHSGKIPQSTTESLAKAKAKS
jgi:uncharacterized membrane protein